MSRGHGAYQRRVIERLSVDEETVLGGLSLAALRPVLGPDRSNACRLVQSLIRRGDIEWVSGPETAARYLCLTFPAAVSALMHLRDAKGYVEDLETPCKPGDPMDAEGVRPRGS